MSVLFQTFFTLVCGHLVGLTFFSARHICDVFLNNTYFFTCDTNDLAGLNEGMLCSGIMMVVFFEILRAVFLALFLMMKQPKPLK